MIADLIAALFVVVILYLLVRPSSQGTAFITAFTTALTAIVTNAADLAAPTESATTDGNENG